VELLVDEIAKELADVGIVGVEMMEDTVGEEEPNNPVEEIGKLIPESVEI